MTLDDRLAEREIYRQLVRFAQAMDERDWDLLDDVVTEDIRSDVGKGPLAGRDALVAVMRRFLDACGPTQPSIGNVLIEVRGATATSRAYVADMHLGPGDDDGLTFRTLGRYDDEWRREGERWRMCRRVKQNRASAGSLAVFGIERASEA